MSPVCDVEPVLNGGLSNTETSVRVSPASIAKCGTVETDSLDRDPVLAGVPVEARFRELGGIGEGPSNEDTRVATELCGKVSS